MISNNPFRLFSLWYQYAQKEYKKHSLLGNTAVISTVDIEGQPSSRILLLKNITESGFIFYTNKNSKKGRNIKDNPKACVLFYWQYIQRQIRLEGILKEVDPSISDKYFQQRPYLSKIGAWASNQSSVMEVGEFAKRVEHYKTLYPQENVPRPPYWVGFEFTPHYFEFWKEGAFRFHTRRTFSLTNDKSWEKHFIYP
jgi:pyridoxamine 5'-phosphate oxidase